jgi:hypothetical protein
MFMSVELDRLGLNVVEFSEPRFELIEVNERTTLPGGQIRTTFGELQMQFGTEEWNEIVRNAGDLEQALGLQLTQDAPVETD